MDGITLLFQQYGSAIRETTIEIEVNQSTIGKVSLPDDQILRNKTIVGMYFWSGADVAPQSGRSLASKNLQENAFINLKSGNLDLTQFSPLAAFGLTDTDKSVKLLYLDQFTPGKSDIQYDISVVDPTPFSFLLTFIYLA